MSSSETSSVEKVRDRIISTLNENAGSGPVREAKPAKPNEVAVHAKDGQKYKVTVDPFQG